MAVVLTEENQEYTGNWMKKVHKGEWKMKDSVRRIFL